MKRLLFVFIFYFGFSEEFCFQWQEINQNFEGNPYRIEAIDSSNVIIATLKQVKYSDPIFSLYISNNGGEKWDSLITPFDLIYDISVVSPKDIWVVADAQKIYYSPDKGINWELKFESKPRTGQYYYIEMFDLNEGIVAGNGSNGNVPPFLKTLDGGDTWENMNLSNFLGSISLKNKDSFDFISVDTGYYMPHSSGVDLNQKENLYKTTNSGISWTPTNYESEVINGQWINFVNENIGYVHSEGNPFNIIYRTIDGGNSWSIVNKTDFFAYGSGMFRTLSDYPEFVLSVLNDQIAISNDTGNTWINVPITSDYPILITDISLVSKQHGWFINYGMGKLFKVNNMNVITDIFESKKLYILEKFELEQNYPNPFNPVTKIKYSIPNVSSKFRSSNKVILKIYDIIGKEVAELVNENKPAGNYEVNFDASDLASGIYYYQLAIGDFIQTKKMILLK